MLALGLISGTSADGIDAALVEFGAHPRLLHACTSAYPGQLRERVLALAQEPEAAISPDAFGELHAELGEAFAAAANAALDASGVARNQVAAIGCHGQTIRHRPQATPPFTLQLGDAARVAERTGITTVADFRARDVAAGGQGAPLMPAFHEALFASASEPRAVLNLGGIGNLSLLLPGTATRGFDTGPANALVDAWCARHHGRAYDRDGALAREGEVDAGLLQRLLDDPYFAQPAPKSSGREHFHLDWLAGRLGSANPRDVPATLLELSALTIAEALVREMPECRRVLVCGGGVHNSLLMARLAERLAPRPVQSSAEHGFDPDFIEAAGFAWLAIAALQRRALDLGGITGARGPRILGAIHPA